MIRSHGWQFKPSGAKSLPLRLQVKPGPSADQLLAWQLSTAEAKARALTEVFGASAQAKARALGTVLAAPPPMSLSAVAGGEDNLELAGPQPTNAEPEKSRSVPPKPPPHPKWLRFPDREGLRDEDADSDPQVGGAEGAASAEGRDGVAEVGGAEA